MRSKSELMIFCTKIVISSFLLSLVAFGATLGAAYCAGRWHCAVGPEITFSIAIGFLVWIFTSAIFVWLFRKQAKIIKHLPLCLSIGLLLISLPKTSGLMVELYAAGFERAVFSVATPEQWISAVSVIKRNSLDLTKGQKGVDNWYYWLPNFVWKVYPGVSFISNSPDRTKATNDIHRIFIDWRGWSFDPALEIKDTNSFPHVFDKIVYQKDFSNYIVFVLVNNNF